MTFLLVQLTHNATGGDIGVAGFFSHYIKFLPAHIPLPTFWSEQERELLRGSSLEAALASKMNSLDREFTNIRKQTCAIDWCKQRWWDAESGGLSLEDWKWLDAIYRSRGLELPEIGHVMVPFLDMANHASGGHALALYETDLDQNAVLLLRPGKALKSSEEVTISYGDEKGACEMLFSYGFLEEDITSAKELFLELAVPDDDPLKLAKQRVANCAPGFRLFEEGGSVSWESSYIWLLCVNEEDGLDFSVLQTTDGEKELQVTWKGHPLQDFNGFDRLVKQDARKDLYYLRAISILQSRVAEQLLCLEQTNGFPSIGHGNGHIQDAASRLRVVEGDLMSRARKVFEEKVRECSRGSGGRLLTGWTPRHSNSANRKWSRTISDRSKTRRMISRDAAETTIASDGTL